MDQGTSKPPMTFSILKRVPDCSEVSTSPAPRPAGAWLQAKQSAIKTAIREYVFTCALFCAFLWLVLNILVKQFQLVTLFTQFNTEQVTYREHADPAIAIDDWKMSRAD